MHSDGADLRAALVEACRAMHREGLVAASSGNASVRSGEGVLITPASLPYDEMTPEDIVELGSDGALVAGDREPSSERRVHLAIYASRPEVGAVVHSHSVHATAWSYLGEVLDTGSEELEHFAGGPVRTAGFAATGGGELATKAVEALGDGRAVLLARHGVVAAAADLREALDVCRVVERQAQIAWLLRGAAR